jgi:sugar lactone lactonase YvrE
MQHHVVTLSVPAAVATPSTLGGTAATGVSADLLGLAPGTTYYYRVVATSPGGMTFASPSGSFTTLSVPTVYPGAASAVSQTGATVGGYVAPNGASTTTALQYSVYPRFMPTVQTTIGSGFFDPTGVAVDAAGDVFVADLGNKAVEKILPNGAMQTILTGFNNPAGVAVDALGDVFVADFVDNLVLEIPAGGGLRFLGSGFNGPNGVAVDAHGDVFVADQGNSAIKEILPNGTIQTIGSGFLHPADMAVDANGDVFVADLGNGAVKEVLPGGTIKTISSGFLNPDGVAVDAAGDVFVADVSSGLVQEVLPGGRITGIGSGFFEPGGVAVVAAGDVFVADPLNNRVAEVAPPSIAATPSPLTGSTSTAISAALTGLTPGTTYYVRAVGSSAAGTVVGAAYSFTTQPKFVTTTALTASPTAVVIGQLDTLTATVAVALPGTVSPTGSVTFFDGTPRWGPPPSRAAWRPLPTASGVSGRT